MNILKSQIKSHINDFEYNDEIIKKCIIDIKQIID